MENFIARIFKRLMAKNIRFQTHRREFKNLKIMGNKPLNDILARVTKLVNQMKCYGKEMLEKMIVEKFLISLSN